MRLLRTDGGGESFTNERLRTIRKMLEYYEIKNIYLLHDHKGLLTVVWESNPTKEQIKIVKDAWSFFGEDFIEFKIVNFQNI
jgi:hypothetical protein